MAETTELKLNAQGFSSKEIDMSDIKLEKLSDYKTILVITSTWGDGDPPSNAMDLLGELQAKKIDLSENVFSVCALGDTAYYQFCKGGKDFDEALEKHGAKRLYPMQECDIDYDMPFEQWLAGVMNVLQNQESN